jgi:CheY-like chemotaxis protein/Tfp pilus assembly protein PilF
MIDIHKMTVLVVDDSMNMCQSISGMMKVVGFGKRFLFGHTGKEALDVLAKEPVDLLLLDNNMPVMTGAEVLSQVRMDRSLRDLPVIMITAEAYQDYVAEIGESEVDAYILKPLMVKVLQEKVAQVIDRANNPPPMIRHLKRARDCEDRGDLEGAVREAQLAVRENPKATRPIRELGYFHLKGGRLNEAEKYLLEAVKRNKLDVFAFHHLGELCLERDDVEKASHYLDRAMKISPRQLGRGLSFGKVLVRRGLLEKAAGVFDRVLGLPAATPELKEEIADFCLDHGAGEYALKVLERLVEEHPKRGDLLIKLGRLLAESGERLRAVTFLTQAAELDAMNIPVRLELARVFLSVKKPILAEKALVQILEVDRGHEEARALLKECS